MIVVVEHLIVSPEHNYVGRFGGPSGNHPGLRQDAVQLIAGRGIAGDRYARREAGHNKQVTFFEVEVIEALSLYFGRPIEPEQVRRNVFLRGLRLSSLVGREFSLNGIRFRGLEPCKPCFWMNEAIGPGAEALLGGRGGLRAAILDDGVLRVGEADFALVDFEP
jgi:MOSC domain-containing protein YiiM